MSTRAKFDNYACVEDYEKDGIPNIEPMLAKELDTDEKQLTALNDPNNYLELKLDGVRAVLIFTDKGVRAFSRRTSDVTGWKSENTDLLPHIRDIPNECVGTIIDGEFNIPNQPFEVVSSVMNCNWEKSIIRQEEVGKVVFHAFDILSYKGINIRKLPLHRRKYYLKNVIDSLSSPYFEEVRYSSCGNKIPTQLSFYNTDVSEKFPTLKKEMEEHDSKVKSSWYDLSPKAYYEYVVATGGEGVMLKSKNGKYLENKRGWEYSKIKKFLTRDVIIVGFQEPTRDYKGKFPTIDKWDYWETDEHDIVDLSNETKEFREAFLNNWSYSNIAPISKHFAQGWVGNISFGVLISDEEIEALPKNKKFDILRNWIFAPKNSKCKHVIVVGECSGFTEEQREEFTKNRPEMLGKVIEVKANDIFKATGKLRHPRFLRVRQDKNPEECTWVDHLQEDVM